MKYKGQVWLETVIYVLIGLVLMGLVLAFIMPKINEKRARLIIEQTVVALSNLDGKVKEVIESGKYNKRLIDFKMQRGNLYMDGQNNQIVYVLEDLDFPYSQPEVNIPLGRVILKTSENRKKNSVNLTLPYGLGTDITIDGVQEIRKFNPSSVPYKFSFENKGIVADAEGNNAYNVDIVRIA